MDDYVSWLWQIEFWHWWAFGFLLIAIEVFAPSTLLIWPAVAAGIIGVLLLIVPGLDWRIQILVFAALSVTTVIWFRFWLRRHPVQTDHPTLNVRGKSMVGRRGRLDAASDGGRGRLHLDDTSWSYATADRTDLPAGTAVEVVGHDGNVLTVRVVDERAAA